MRRVPRPGAATRRQWLGLAASMAWAPAQATLRDDERVLFLPGTARRLDAGRIEADLHAWVYEPERRPGLRTAFARYLGLDQSAMSAADRERFRRRCGLFLADSERGKEVVVRFDAVPAQPVRLPATDAAGRSRLRAVIDGAPRRGNTAHLDFHAVLADGDTRRFAGRALLVPPEGLSVVSDIDDTIKLTEVRDRREMLLNTFARPSRAAPGMAARYRRLAAAPGARVHYLSASPMQLLPVLEDFLAAAGFPAAACTCGRARAGARWCPARANRGRTSSARSRNCCTTSRPGASCSSATPARPIPRSTPRWPGRIPDACRRS